MFELKITVELCVLTLKVDAMFIKKMTAGLKNDVRNLVNIYVCSRRSENLHFHRLVLPKAYKFSDGKTQKSYTS